MGRLRDLLPSDVLRSFTVRGCLVDFGVKTHLADTSLFGRVQNRNVKDRDGYHKLKQTRIPQLNACGRLIFKAHRADAEQDGGRNSVQVWAETASAVEA